MSKLHFGSDYLCAVYPVKRVCVIFLSYLFLTLPQSTTYLLHTW